MKVEDLMKNPDLDEIIDMMQDMAVLAVKVRDALIIYRHSTGTPEAS